MKLLEQSVTKGVIRNSILRTKIRQGHVHAEIKVRVELNTNT